MSTSDSPGKLPDKASIEQLRKQAKELQRSTPHPSLTAAQFALAKSYGFESWPKMAFAVKQEALRVAIRDGETEQLCKLLTETPRLAKAPFGGGSWPLHEAAEYNDPAMIQLLVEAGAQMEPRYGGSAHSALSWAVTCWSFAAAVKLVELGAKPDLFSAAGLGVLPLVQAFWRDGKLIKNPSRTGSSRYSASGERLPTPPPNPQDQVSDALYMACRADRLEVARWLLDHDADPNWLGFAGASCLAWAEFSGNPELCALLRERGGSDDLLDATYRATPKAFALMVLIGWGFPARNWIARFQADPSLVHARSEWGTLLHVAAAGGQVESTRVLLALGAARNALNAQGQTPAEVAEAGGHSEVAAMLR